MKYREKGGIENGENIYFFKGTENNGEYKIKKKEV